jgi:hypothetical protein
MCCFNHPIDHVHSTRIFVGDHGGRQLTVYSAALIGHRIEMVLPVRSYGAAEIEWVDLKAYPEFFADCLAASLLRRPRPATTAAMKAGAAAPGAPPPLEVVQVGDYKVSFAPGPADLERADPRVFQLSDRLKAVMQEHYSGPEWGFVIYKPDHGGEMHPLAYRHAVKPGQKLFVPTRHEHGHDGPPDWDHTIFHQGDAEHVDGDRRQIGEMPAEKVFRLASEQGKPVPPEVDLSRPMARLERHGPRFPNGDVELLPMAAAGFSREAMLGAGAVAAGAAVYHGVRSRRTSPATPAPEDR